MPPPTRTPSGGDLLHTLAKPAVRCKFLRGCVLGRFPASPVTRTRSRRLRCALIATAFLARGAHRHDLLGELAALHTYPKRRRPTTYTGQAGYALEFAARVRSGLTPGVPGDTDAVASTALCTHEPPHPERSAHRHDALGELAALHTYPKRRRPTPYTRQAGCASEFTARMRSGSTPGVPGDTDAVASTALCTYEPRHS